MRNSKFFRFVDGVPVPVDEDIQTNVRVNKHTMSALLPAALDIPHQPKMRRVMVMVMKGHDEETGNPLWKEVAKRDPYTGEYLYEIDPDEYQFQNEDGTWMSKAEVGAIRLAQRFADGEAKAQEQVLDRIIGKPKQEIEQTVTKLDPIAWMRAKMKELQENTKQQIRVDPPSAANIEAVDVTVIKPKLNTADYI